MNRFANILGGTSSFVGGIAYEAALPGFGKSYMPQNFTVDTVQEIAAVPAVGQASHQALPSASTPPRSISIQAEIDTTQKPASPLTTPETASPVEALQSGKLLQKSGFPSSRFSRDVRQKSSPISEGVDILSVETNSKLTQVIAPQQLENANSTPAEKPPQQRTTNFPHRRSPPLDTPVQQAIIVLQEKIALPGEMPQGPLPDISPLRERPHVPNRSQQSEGTVVRPALHIDTLEIQIEAPRPSAAPVPRVTPVFSSNSFSRLHIRGR
jgi:hypothetical protein